MIHKEMFMVRDKRNGKYKIKSTGFSSNMWTENKGNAMLFKAVGAAKKGMYCYNINPDRGHIGAKIILPDWVEIIPVELKLVNITPCPSRERVKQKTDVRISALQCLWRNDGERFSRNEDGTYSMDNSEMVHPYKYSYARLMDTGVFSVYPPTA